LSRRIWLPLALLAAAAATVTLGLTGAASGAAAGGLRGHFLALPGGAKSGTSSAFKPLALSNKQVGYILQLRGTPVAVADAASKDAGRGGLSAAQKGSLIRQLKAAQSPVAQAVRQIGGTVTHSFQTVYNGIAVRIAARDAYKLSGLTGVKAVFQEKTFTRANVNSVPLIGGPETWGGTPGYTGTGVKIADIDTGLDYTHADFGGSGDVADWNCAFDNSTADPSTVDCPGGNLSQWFGSGAPKVKGGWDFVGDDYNASGSGSELIPQPDPNPLDCNSHGTHTAGTLAGFGVLSNGDQYTGPYNADTISNNTWNVGPGVAPNASLYALRVFGCAGSVDDATLISAIEWAVNHGMNVINMSLGADFGSASDPDSVAASTAAQDGVIVVSASGNAGDSPFITSSPAAGTRGIAAAANDSTPSFPAADLTLTTNGGTSGDGGTLTAINANGYDFTPGDYNLMVIYSAPGVISLGCSVAADGGANSLPANTVIVVARGTCARVAKAIYGQQAGAAGVIMVNNNSGYPPFEGKITSNPDTGDSYTVTIPFLGVPGGSNPSASAAGQQLIASDGGTVNLQHDTLANPNYLYLASFSSYGPSTGGFLKPEITAPGVSVDSAGMGTGTEALYDSGTSMATPHVAGEAALVRQAHPTWRRVKYYKDAIVNTANPDNVANFSLRGAGSGEASAYDATHTQVVAGGYPDGMASLNFGIPAVKTDYSHSEYIRLHNFGSTPATFDLADSADQGADHSVSFSIGGLSASSVTVPAHSGASVKVTLAVPLSSAADSVTSFNDWYGGGQFDDIGGLITLTPENSDNSGIGLSVAYYGVPTAASAVKARVNTVALRKNGTASALISNVSGGAEGYADWFAQTGSSPVAASDIGSGDLLADGVQSFPDFGYLEFGIKVAKPWTNPAEDYFEIDMDVNNDGTPDYAVLSIDLGAFLTGSADGIPVVVVYDLGTNTFDIEFLSGAMWNGTTMELPVLFSQLCDDGQPCITPGTPVNFATFSQDRNGGQDAILDNTAYDLFSPAFSNGTAYPGGDAVDPGTTGTDQITLDPTAWSANPPLGFLVLAQNNRGPHNADESMSIPFSLNP
jgi:minor extracellular serine protease Vpr